MADLSEPREKLDSSDIQPLRIKKKHPLAIRWFHWINFPVIAIMIWSGLLIYWANGVFYLGPFKLFPDWFYHPGFRETPPDKPPHPGLYDLTSRLAEGMSWHFFFMWFFTINGILYVLYTALSGEWRHILPSRSTFKEAIHVVLHDLHLRKDPPPRAKFNGAQKLAYTGVIAMGLGSLITGIAIYKPVQASFFTQLMGGYTVARFLHFWLMMFFILFFLVHIAQVIRAGWNNFRSMITGYELVSEEESV
jgi:thiosulfate reductase cytochrome b subunit